MSPLLREAGVYWLTLALIGTTLLICIGHSMSPRGIPSNSVRARIRDIAWSLALLSIWGMGFNAGWNKTDFSWPVFLYMEITSTPIFLIFWWIFFLVVYDPPRETRNSCAC